MTVVANEEKISTEIFLKKLVLVDDDVNTYNMYKNNTIKIDQWTKDMRNDCGLLSTLEIIEQLTSSLTTDVQKDLQYIIDMHGNYN